MSRLKQLTTYLKQALAQRRAHACASGWLELVEFFPLWRGSLEAQANPVTDQRPWITFPAIRFLERILTAEMRVFEYGCGGSTLFAAQRVKEVISVEHDAAWASQVTAALARNGRPQPKVSLFEPVADTSTRGRDPSDPEAYVSSADQYAGFSFHAYAASIEAYPDDSFDLVLIDGRARPSCCKHAVGKVKVGGFVMLDNAERGHYRSIHQRLETPQWQKLDLSGPGPYNTYFWRTIAWKKLTSAPGSLR